MLAGFCLHFFHAFLSKHKICLHNCHNSLIYDRLGFAHILNRSQARSNWVQSQLWHRVANVKTNLSKLWKMKCNPVLGRLRCHCEKENGVNLNQTYIVHHDWIRHGEVQTLGKSQPSTFCFFCLNTNEIENCSVRSKNLQTSLTGETWDNSIERESLRLDWVHWALQWETYWHTSSCQASFNLQLVCIGHWLLGGKMRSTTLPGLVWNRPNNAQSLSPVVNISGSEFPWQVSWVTLG